MSTDTTQNEARTKLAQGAVLAEMLERPVVVEARRINKTFRIPLSKVDSLKERITRPTAKTSYRELRALNEISFDIHQGEFFGIVGRNGSGKSSLLKILASIYRPDQGTVRVAGRLAPFIEMGVGFNPELTARDNVVFNGVLMGKSLRSARRGLDEILEFSELTEFADLKLKNYSSGMMVRLAFSVMAQADGDVMLIDEVLAVGDASFAQKCMDVFQEKRAAGKTIILVTHDMSTVQAFCHRAMLIHDGEMKYLGNPEEAALGYYRLNFDPASFTNSLPNSESGLVVARQLNARLIEAKVLDSAGNSLASIEQGQPINLRVKLEAARRLESPKVTINVRQLDGPVIFGFERDLQATVDDGDHITLAGQIDHRLLAGQYVVECWVRSDRNDNVMGLQVMKLAHFDVRGATGAEGLVSVDSDIEAVIQRRSVDE